MELKEIQKKEEPLLARTKAEYEAVFDKATPSIKEVKSVLAKKMGKEEKLIDITGIYNAYGLKKARILLYAYKDEDTLKKIKIEGKKAKEKAEKKDTKAAEADAKQGPKEETKPEAKEEPKKEAKAEGKKEEPKQESKREKQEQKPEAKEKETSEKK